MVPDLGLINKPLRIMLGSGLMLSEALAGASPMSSSEDDCHSGSFGQQDALPVASKQQPNSASSQESYSNLEQAFAAMSIPAPISPVSEPQLIQVTASIGLNGITAGKQDPSLIALSPCCPVTMHRSVWCLEDYDLLALLHTGDASHVHKVSTSSEQHSDTSR